MNQRTRKLIMMHKALHLRDEIDRLESSEKKEDKNSPALKTTWMY